MKKTLFISVAVLLVVAFAVGALVYKTKKGEEAQERAQAFQSVQVRPYSPAHGSAEAKVVIAEFLDPACGTCREFYPLVQKMMADHPGRIRVVLRYAPFHPNSDQVVAMIYAAGKQGKHWEALEATLAAQNDWVTNHVANPDRAWQHLAGLGLNLDQLRSDMNAPEIAAQIKQDIDDARSLNVTATPEFFVNGKPLPTWGYEQLVELVNSELASAYR